MVVGFPVVVGMLVVVVAAWDVLVFFLLSRMGMDKAVGVGMGVFMGMFVNEIAVPVRMGVPVQVLVAVFVLVLQLPDMPGVLQPVGVGQAV